MANKEVNVTKRVQIGDGLRYCPVVLTTKGRIKPDYVLVKGVQEYHPDGCYYIEWHEGKKRIRLSVGKDAADATTQRLKKEAELNARNNGVPVTEAPKFLTTRPSRKPLKSFSPKSS